MKKLIYLTGLVALAVVTIFAWSQAELPSSRDAGATVGVSQRALPPQKDAAMPSPELLLRRAGPLPIESWDAH